MFTECMPHERQPAFKKAKNVDLLHNNSIIHSECRFQQPSVGIGFCISRAKLMFFNYVMSFSDEVIGQTIYQIPKVIHFSHVKSYFLAIQQPSHLVAKLFSIKQ